ncbi:NUDIX hydrolase [Micromonospora pallida]|uniref:NUDIX hydrolase n=1 Tax=Micromonospora pallida TaxID=145854 RepID=UPI00114D21BB|nr:NUDIX hydrolase [Micromonospora pallida]
MSFVRTVDNSRPAYERRGLAQVEHLVRAHLHTPVARTAPRPAVTVVLLRDGEPGLEAFLLECASTMAFAPRQTVFPGGSLDAADAHVRAFADCEELASWGKGFGCDLEHAAQLLVAAVREVFEESGVLLALDTRTGHPIPGAGLAACRQELVTKTRTFADVLEATGAVLSPALLYPWARWVTPEWSPRRYDTHFLVAALPTGQWATDGSGEAVSVAWRTSADGRADS